MRRASPHRRGIGDNNDNARHQRFRRQIRERERLGLGQRQRMFAKAVLRMGVPVGARNIFPSNIQGLAHMV